MAIEITHAFVSAKGDGGDATLIRPSNWNAVHDTSMATGNLIGRTSSGAGAFEEIPISTYMAGLLAAADKDALADLLGLFTTGDVKWSYDTSASTGWVVVNAYGGTIGNAASTATLRANEDTKTLWKLIYDNVVDAYAPVSGGRTGNSENDFNAGKKLTLYLQGRSPIGAGNGLGGVVSTRALGTTVGAEIHTLTTTEMPSHYHAAAIYDPAHSHSSYTALLAATGTYWNYVDQEGSPDVQIYYRDAAIAGNYTGVRVNSSNGLDTTYSAGSGGAHNNMHPVIALYAHIKL